MSTLIRHIVSVLLFIFSVTGYAFPFKIAPTPGTELPTTVTKGETEYAYYTIYNTTYLPQSISDNFVKYLPDLPAANVVQVFEDEEYEDEICGPTFTLAPTGSEGDSCVLKLAITGAVESQCTTVEDIPHCLFVCMSDGMSCVGTTDNLQVEEVELAYIANHSESFKSLRGRLAFSVNGDVAYVPQPTNDNDNSVAVCSVDDKGRLFNCSNFSDANFSKPSGLDINATGTRLYVANSNDTVAICAIDPYNPTLLGDCTSSRGVDSDGVPTFKFNNSAVNLFARSSDKVAYIPNRGNDTISICPIKDDGSFDACSVCGDSDGCNETFNYPTSFWADNASSGKAYVANASGDTVSICDVNSDNTLGECKIFSDLNFYNPADVILNNARTHAYVVNVFKRTIFVCPVNADGDLEECTEQDVNGIYKAGLTFSPVDDSRLYFTAEGLFGDGGGVMLCSIDTSTGLLDGKCREAMLFSISICATYSDDTLGECKAYSDLSFSRPVDIILNNARTYAYVANTSTNTISVCPVNANGGFEECTEQDVNITWSGLNFNPVDDSRLYLTDEGSLGNSHVMLCSIDTATGLFEGECEDSGQQFSQSRGRLAFSVDGSVVYVPQLGNDSVAICLVGEGGGLSNCSNFSHKNLAGPLGLDINATGTRLYVANSNDTVAICAIDPYNPTLLGDCTSSRGVDSDGVPTFNFEGRVVNLFTRSSDKVAYIPNSANDTISICPIKDDGSFDACSVCGGSGECNETFIYPVSFWKTSLSSSKT